MFIERETQRHCGCPGFALSFPQPLDRDHCEMTPDNTEFVEDAYPYLQSLYNTGYLAVMRLPGIMTSELSLESRRLSGMESFFTNEHPFKCPGLKHFHASSSLHSPVWNWT